MNRIGLVIILGLMSPLVMANSKVEVVLEDYIKAWNAHDKAKIDNFYAENVVWYDITSDTLIKGKENVGPAITDYFMGYVPNMYWVKSGDLYVSGNTAVYEWVYGGTFNGQWGDKKITNKDFVLKGISTTTINEKGKIIAHKDYYDMDSFKRALGVTL